MAEYTQNYNLKKPAEEDFYNVKDFNDNADIIDQALKAHDDALATKETPAGAQAKVDAALASAKDYTDQQISAITPEQIGAETPAGAQAKVDAHNSQTSVHGATSAATANKIIMRDSAGRAKVAAPSASDDIARKDTVDNHAGVTSAISTLGHVYEAEFTATITAASWSGTTPPYSNVVTVSGITSSHNPIIDVIMSGTYSTDQQRGEQWGNIYRAVTSSNTITFYAHEKPTIDLPIRVKVVM